MKKSNSKPKKFLADGTEAKVGIIIFYEGYVGRIRYVKHPEDPNGTVLLTECPTGWEHIGRRFPKIPDGIRLYHMWTDTSRKATSEERKEYYRRLWAVSV